MLRALFILFIVVTAVAVGRGARIPDGPPSCEYRCPNTDTAQTPLNQAYITGVQDANVIRCGYPWGGKPAECDYGKYNGTLLRDQDAGLCLSRAVPKPCPYRRNYPYPI